jgi:triosephosphate isomerase
MRRPLVAGNWKMNGTRASVAELLDALGQQDVVGAVEVVVFPSTLHVTQAVGALEGKGVAVGAQDCAAESGFGAFTGETSVSQLSDVGCEWVLIGHSERRLVIGESDDLVSRKFVAALNAGLTPILCVGETLEQRQAGKTLEVISQQLGRVVGAAGIASFEKAVVAYEPVWAIGSGLTASPEQAQEVHAAIREQLARDDKRIAQGARLLYGGSVKADNAADLFAMPDIDGGLIGGASLNANDFSAICRAAGN